MRNAQKLVQAFAEALAIPQSEVVDALSYQGIAQWDGPSSFRVEPNSQNCLSSSSPVGMWAGCL